MLRLIAFILFSIVFLVFIVFNLDNSCDVSLGFKTFTQLPVFLTVFTSFLAGMFFALIFVVSSGRRRRKPAQAGAAPAEGGGKRWGKKGGNSRASNPGGNGASAETENYSGPLPGRGGKESGSADPQLLDEIKKENGLYGID